MAFKPYKANAHEILALAVKKDIIVDINSYSHSRMKDRCKRMFKKGYLTRLKNPSRYQISYRITESGRLLMEP